MLVKIISTKKLPEEVAAYIKNVYKTNTQNINSALLDINDKFNLQGNERYLTMGHSEHGAVFFCLCCVFALPTGYCSQTYTITQEQLTTLETNLIQLKKNNSELQNLLNKSNQELMTASKQSEELNSQITKLKTQLMTSQTQIQTLTQQLQTLKTQSQQAQDSLTIASEELNKVSQSLKISEQEQNKLKKQRLLWQIIAGTLLIFK